MAGAGDLSEVSRAVLALPPPDGPPRLGDQLLDGLARLVADGAAAAAPALRQAAHACAGEDSLAADGLRWGWLAQTAAIVLGSGALWPGGWSGCDPVAALWQCRAQGRWALRPAC
jgi:hypothetical protein